jgi:hypothetical protein
MDHATSRTVIFDFGRDQYRAACLAVLGPDVTPELRYGGVPAEEPANDKYWARVTRRVVTEFQETLRNGESQRRFCTVGIVFVQVFGPVGGGTVLSDIDRTAELVRNSFRLYQGDNLEFTNAVISDTVTPDPNWISASIRSNYRYRQFVS